MAKCRGVPSRILPWTCPSNFLRLASSKVDRETHKESSKADETIDKADHDDLDYKLQEYTSQTEQRQEIVNLWFSGKLYDDSLSSMILRTSMTQVELTHHHLDFNVSSICNIFREMKQSYRKGDNDSWKQKLFTKMPTDMQYTRNSHESIFPEPHYRNLMIPNLGSHSGFLLESFFKNAFISLKSSKMLSTLRGGETVQLDDYDLHHAHLVCHLPSDQIAICFHLAEYPQYHPRYFPYHLGKCQELSTLIPNPSMIDTRNVIWVEQYPHVVFVLDVLRHPWNGFVFPHTPGTIMESEFGNVLCDVFYDAALDNQGGSSVIVYPHV